MIDNYMLAGEERQSALEAAKAAFFNSGGCITELASFEYKPLPDRKHPEPKPVKVEVKADKPPTQRQRKYADQVEMMAEMATRMTCSDVARELGISQERAWNIAKQNGFSYQLAARGRVRCIKYDDAMDIALAERIKAMRQIGVSRNQACLHLGISHPTMTRVIEKFGIDYPRAVRGKKS